MKLIHIKKNVMAYIVPALTVTFFLMLIAISVFSVRYKTKQFSGEAMASDIAQLATIFEQIHQECEILSFDYQKNPINFLNVGSFAGSEVGSMNLAQPKNWKGPYLQDNLTMQNKEYQIVDTDYGYFIVPGLGVQLPNGQVIGEDIDLNRSVNIPALTKENQPLSFQNQPLAASIMLDGQTNQKEDIDLDDLPNLSMGYE